MNEVYLPNLSNNDSTVPKIEFSVKIPGSTYPYAYRIIANRKSHVKAAYPDAHVSIVGYLENY